MSDLFSKLKTWFTEVFNKIKEVFTNIFNTVKDKLTNIFNNVKEVFTNIYNAIKTPIDNAKNTANMQWKMWYVTKKDGTCWQSEEEKNSTNVEDMLVYENKEDIPEGNKTVGAYFESQYGGQLEGERSSIYIRFKIQITIICQRIKITYILF